MRRTLWLLVAATAFGADLKQLYDAHRWFELRDAIASLPAGQRGILGLPVLIALETIRWTREGSLEIGRPSGKPQGSRICFDGTDPLTEMEMEGHRVDMVLDTGGDDSEFWLRFANDFPSLMDKGTSGSRQLTGFAGSSSFDALILPTLSFQVAGLQATLRDVPVLHKKSVPASAFHHGRLSLDVLHQAREVTLDLKSLRLSLR